MRWLIRPASTYTHKCTSTCSEHRADMMNMMVNYQQRQHVSGTVSYFCVACQSLFWRMETGSVIPLELTAPE